MSIAVQPHDFDVAAEITALRAGRTDVGAVCSFIGTVRDVVGQKNTRLTLEHYPGMTEAALTAIHGDALHRFNLIDAKICHRYGALVAGDNIVLVIALSAHRQAAFDGANYMMDRLKTDAPFWKLEDDAWVESRDADTQAKDKWS